MATIMNQKTPPGNALGRYRKKRTRSLGALVAGVSLATSLTVGSGLSGLLPFLGEKAVAATTLRGLVYIDFNQNGVQDVTADVATNEPGRPNVSVTAFGRDGAVAGSAATLGDGTWQIVTDAQGPFRVEFNNYASTQIASGNNLGGTSVQFTAGAAPVNFSLFGKVNGLGSLEELAYKPLQIGNRVWQDTNRNGVQDAEEPGIPGVLVKLVDEAGDPAVDVSNGTQLPDVVTNGGGEYYFDNLGGGRTYRVVIDPAQPALAGLSLTTAFSTSDGGDVLSDSNGIYVAQGDPETALGSKPIAVGSIVARVVTGGPGQNDHSFDFGLVTTVTAPKLSIGDYVFVDVNGNGIQDDGDVALSGATVTLLDGTGTPIPGKSVTVGDDGLYLFDGLDAGTYRVRVVRPAASNVTPAQANVGSNDDVDSDTVGESAESAVTGPIELTTNITNVDSGWVPASGTPTFVLGDRVFIDVNRNGVQDDGDLNVNGATVELLDGTGTPIAGRSVITGGNGAYLFTGLDAGSYQVRVTRPVGSDVAPTTANTGGDDAVDSDFAAVDADRAVSGVITLTADDLTVDSGWVTPLSDSGTARIGDRVFFDRNANGIQDQGEPGLVGVSTTLQTCAGADIFSLASVDNGLYEYSQLPAGTYRIRFVLPDGYEFTVKGAGNDTGLDSDADPATGFTDCVTLVDGESNLTVDVGLVAKTSATTTTVPGATTTTVPGATTTTTIPVVTTTTAPVVTTTTAPVVTTTTAPVKAPAKIGDRVFVDSNGNGIQDPTEVGMVGAKVNLETCGGVFISSTLTIADGRYEFADLPAGQYRIRFELPVGYDFTTRGIGTDIGLDSDADVLSGVTGCVTLAEGETNATVDAGLVQRITVVVVNPTTTTTIPTVVTTATTPITVPPATACIGDKVFEGKAGDRDGKGIPGITLVLVVEDGSTVSTVTDANGLYRFCTLKPGTYTVRITVPPAGATNIYTLDGKNNNATSVVLPAGRDNLDADFGYDLGKNVQVLPAVEVGPDFPETPIIIPSVTGSNGTRQGLGGLALILTGVGMVGLLRSRKQHWN